MRSFEQWMDAYGESHQNPLNKAIHKICVPLIVWSILGLLWLVPTPKIFAHVPYLNWGTLALAGTLLFYLTLSFRMFLGGLLFGVLFSAALVPLARWSYTGMLYVCVGVFFVSWVGQFYGHKVEGKKPSFLQDLTFLLIGPLWVLRSFYALFSATPAEKTVDAS